MAAEPEYMTVGEAMEALGVSKKTVAKLIADGKLHTERDPLDGRIKRIARSEVEQLAAQSARRGKEAA